MITSTDPIADLLTRIRNASAVRKALVTAPFSKLKMEVAKVLEREGFVENVVKRDNAVHIGLKYDDRGKPRITGIKRISKPGLRIYRGSDNLPRVTAGKGVSVISTPQGLKTNKEAYRLKLGGEVMCEIW